MGALATARAGGGCQGSVLMVACRFEAEIGGGNKRVAERDSLNSASLSAWGLRECAAMKLAAPPI